MAIPSWPSNIEYKPAPTMWAPPLFTAPRSTAMEGGNKRLRVKPGDAVAVSKWGRDLINGQFALFRTFYRDTLLNGSLRFTMPICLDASTFETRTVQIVPGTLRTTALEGDGVVVAFELKVFP